MDNERSSPQNMKCHLYDRFELFHSAKTVSGILFQHTHVLIQPAYSC